MHAAHAFAADVTETNRCVRARGKVALTSTCRNDLEGWPDRISTRGRAIYLRDMAKMAILIHMKTTLNIDDRLLAEARRLTKIDEKTALVHAGLEALIARASARRLAALGGSESAAVPVPRRRSRSRRGV